MRVRNAMLLSVVCTHHQQVLDTLLSLFNTRSNNNHNIIYYISIIPLFIYFIHAKVIII